MSRSAVVGWLLAAGTLAAADPPAGSWKLPLRTERQPLVILVAFSQADGKWVADYVDSTAKFPQDPKFTGVAVAGDSIKFTLALAGQTLFTFDGLVAKDGKKITGSVGSPGSALALIEMRPSSLKKLSDPFDVEKEAFAQSDDAQSAYESAQVILGQAAAKKLTPEEARGVLDRVAKLSAGYGPRWERSSALRMASILADQDGFADAALAQARRAERLLTDDDEAGTRLEILDTLARILEKAKKPDEAKTYAAQAAKLEARDYQDYAKKTPPFPVEAFKGRKGKSERVVLAEFFSGAEFGPSAPFDIARDAVAKMYGPADVLVLDYHVHIGGLGDPLTNAESLERFGFYQDTVRRGGLALVAGKAAARAKEGMSAADSAAVFAAVKQQIDEQLEKAAGAKLTLTLAPAGKGFAAKATYDVEKPDEKLALRFAVVEERVRYAGGNGIRYHANVVRAMPGGAKGYPVKGKSGEQAVTVNVDDVRAALTKYLDDYAKESEFPRSDRPLGLRNLKLVAFLQNDTTTEVLTATAVELAAK